MKHLLWLGVFTLCTSAFAQKTKPRKLAAAKKTTALAAEPVLIVQRTPCHGACPVYTAAIFADGRVEYDGERSVTLLGKHILHLPTTTVSQLLTEAKFLNFNKLQDQCMGNTYDLPTTIVTAHPAGQPAKTVRAQAGMPAALEDYLVFLVRQLDSLVNKATNE